MTATAEFLEPWSVTEAACSLGVLAETRLGALNYFPSLPLLLLHSIRDVIRVTVELAEPLPLDDEPDSWNALALPLRDDPGDIAERIRDHVLPGFQVLSCCLHHTEDRSTAYRELIRFLDIATAYVSRSIRLGEPFVTRSRDLVPLHVENAEGVLEGLWRIIKSGYGRFEKRMVRLPLAGPIFRLISFLLLRVLRVALVSVRAFTSVMRMILGRSMLRTRSAQGGHEAATRGLSASLRSLGTVLKMLLQTGHYYPLHFRDASSYHIEVQLANPELKMPTQFTRRPPQGIGVVILAPKLRKANAREMPQLLREEEARDRDTHKDILFDAHARPSDGIVHAYMTRRLNEAPTFDRFLAHVYFYVPIRFAKRITIGCWILGFSLLLAAVFVGWQCLPTLWTGREPALPTPTITVGVVLVSISLWLLTIHPSAPLVGKKLTGIRATAAVCSVTILACFVAWVGAEVGYRGLASGGSNDRGQREEHTWPHEDSNRAECQSRLTRSLSCAGG